MCEGISLAGVMITCGYTSCATSWPGWDGYPAEQEIWMWHYAGAMEFPKGCTGTSHSGKAFRLGAKLYLAEAYQIPVILMTINIFSILIAYPHS